MTLANFPKLERDGKVAVVYHEGFGGGWSSECDMVWRPIICMHRDIATSVLDGTPDTLAIANRILSDTGAALDYLFFGDVGKLRVTWVPKGALFRIDEYDGSEQVIVGTDDMMTA